MPAVVPLSVSSQLPPLQSTVSIHSFLAASAAAPALHGSLSLLHLILLKIKVILLPSILLFLCLMLICSLLDWYADEKQIYRSHMNSDEAATHAHIHTWAALKCPVVYLPFCQSNYKDGWCVSSSEAISLKSLLNWGFKWNYFKQSHSFLRRRNMSYI